MIEFKTLSNHSRMWLGNLIYRDEEYSFDFEPAPPGAFTSVLINNLNLEVDAEGRLVSIWGMCPRTTWKPTSLAPPPADKGDVFIVSEPPLIRGVSIQVNEDGSWPVCVDLASGWLRVASGRTSIRAMNALPGIVVEIADQDDIAALWLKPANLPKSIPQPPASTSA